jgi:hypothetical protein
MGNIITFWPYNSSGRNPFNPQNQEAFYFIMWTIKIGFKARVVVCRHDASLHGDSITAITAKSVSQKTNKKAVAWLILERSNRLIPNVIIKKWINHSIITTVQLIRNSLMNQNNIFPLCATKIIPFLHIQNFLALFFQKMIISIPKTEIK